MFYPFIQSETHLHIAVTTLLLASKKVTRQTYTGGKPTCPITTALNEADSKWYKQLSTQKFI